MGPGRWDRDDIETRLTPPGEIAPQWSLVAGTGMTQHERGDPRQQYPAAMEPGRWDRDDGSGVLPHLGCDDEDRCEYVL